MGIWVVKNKKVLHQNANEDFFEKSEV